MNGSYGCMEGLQRPIAEVLTQVEPVVSSEAAGIPEGVTAAAAALVEGG